jgi:hypothetical protein
MARIPRFTRTVLLNRSNASNVDAIAQAGSNQARGHLLEAQKQQNRFRIAGQFQAEHQRQLKAEGRVRAQERFNEFQRDRISVLQEQHNQRQTQPSGFADEFDKWHLGKQKEMEAQLSEEKRGFDMDYFRQLMDRDRTSVFNTNTNWENSTRLRNTYVGAEQAIDDMNANFAMTNPTFKDLVDHQKKIRDYVNDVGSEVFGVDDSIKLTEYAIDNAANTFFDQKLQEDPQSVKRVLEYGQGGRDSLIDFVMNDIEGGGRYVKDGKGYAKYGINSHANPDIDVKNLTPEKAREVYKSRYWDKRLDDYDPAFQAVAFDALVNHGNDKDTWKMIEAADGNPRMLLRARQEEYARLIEADPKTYGKNQAGWNRRINELQSYVQDLEAGGREFLDNAQLVDSRILSDVRGRTDSAIASKKAQEEREAAEAQQVDKVTQIIKFGLMETMTKEIQHIIIWKAK